MKVINWLDRLYSKLPGFGPEIKDFIIVILPYLSVATGILITLSSILDIIGTPFISVFTLNNSSPLLQTLLLINVLGILQGILMMAAFRGLKRKTYKGWRLIFWSQILWVTSALIATSPTFILGLIFLYPLFQVRSNYR